MASSTATGARVVFKVGNTPVAFANAMNYTVAHAHQPVDVLGMPEPAEYAETGYTVNFTCTMFRVFTKGAVAQGLKPRLEDLMRQPELVVSMHDAINTSTPLFSIGRVKCTQEDFSVDARNISQLVLSFVGIKLTEEDATSNSGRSNDLVTDGTARQV